MSRGVRWFLIGSARSCHAGRMRPGLSSIMPSASHGGARRRSPASTPAPSRKAPALVRISPIEGPGMCGADFPLKVSALGEGPAHRLCRRAGASARSDRRREPPAAEPRWPICAAANYPRAAAADRRADVDRTAGRAPQPSYPQQQVLGAPPSNLQAPPDWQRARPVSRATIQRRDAAPPRRGRGDRNRRAAALCAARRGADRAAAIRATDAAALCRRSARRAIRSLRAPTPIEVKPAATLACPIVSALDRWFANAVQPAAQKWFSQPVVEIKQISAYSCRGMNGQAGAPISEHAFGNALDIAAFVLADGHRITVKDGWKGSPEEQGFLRDVQGVGLRSVHHGAGAGLQPIPLRPHPRRPDAARERPAHLQPGAVDGDVVAAQARKNPSYAVAAVRAAADAALRSAGRAGQRSVRLARRRPPRRSRDHRLDRRAAARHRRTRRPMISTGSRSRGRGRRSTGAAAGTRSTSRSSASVSGLIESRAGRTERCSR